MSGLPNSHIQEFSKEALSNNSDATPPEPFIAKELTPVQLDKYLRLLIRTMVKMIQNDTENWRSRSRSMAITKLEEAKFWLGNDLGEMRDAGKNDEPYPYASGNILNQVVEPEAE